jgi:tRNA G18 (ribose-2'-O)-methylase SpoU
METSSSPSTGVITIIAHNIRSAHNVGSIFRAADCFGVSKVYLTGYTPGPDMPQHVGKIGKVSLGAELSVPWERTESAEAVVASLKSAGATVVALENNIPGTQSLPDYQPAFPLALVLGEEVGGIEQSLLALVDVTVELPLLGQKESLNVSVACGIALYQFRWNWG